MEKRKPRKANEEQDEEDRKAEGAVVHAVVVPAGRFRSEARVLRARCARGCSLTGAILGWVAEFAVIWTPSPHTRADNGAAAGTTALTTLSFVQKRLPTQGPGIRLDRC